MKKIVTCFGGVLLTFLYCFALYSVAHPLSETYAVNTPISEKHQDVFSVTKSLFSLTSEADNFSVSFGPTSPSEYSKLPVFNSHLCPKLNERIVNAQISQYTTYQTNTLVNYRKNDLIYPFHYFW
ncbi:hypothetical protein FNB79_12315 [Formosa sediminum]|uniref:Uncharacterized protein n=1 Tax=Formosa sediminum TaxID=2594004 RepID=A0A516GT81_9FLAO|nr:hypothetical protein [Formosa sediminum]QDO94712.1 hypothetical protein FNB79_12315 [Formosa sediminum]